MTVLTNTPPRGAQSAPGGMQGIIMMEPLLAKAARKLGDRSGGHPTNQLLPKAKRSLGPREQGQARLLDQRFLKEALDRGAEQFKWKERVARSEAQRHEGARRRRLVERILSAVPPVSTDFS